MVVEDGLQTAEQGLSVVLEGEELGGEFRIEWHPCKERGGGFVGVESVRNFVSMG